MGLNVVSGGAAASTPPRQSDLSTMLERIIGMTQQMRESNGRLAGFQERVYGPVPQAANTKADQLGSGLAGTLVAAIDDLAAAVGENAERSAGLSLLA